MASRYCDFRHWLGDADANCLTVNHGAEMRVAEIKGANKHLVAHYPIRFQESRLPI